ncbi:uncharacterized protein LOC100261851 isoform X3 [Vitis vinifera]|nr:uncharacterized protein LOC100261851 isoform X3 [Vitis vinifera]|eukprot:XP_019080723.1 PREDICTED: uncharacterized protein LOC100261851 isoform X3 [Vitis vinifera]
METKEGEKPIKRKYRGMTRKHMIIKNRSKGVKLPVKYNLDGIFIGESTVHLTSYLGVLARTMVPIRYKTWHVVPKQLKDKLWDSIETAFSLNHKSRRNCMLTMGKCFRSFKNLLTVKYILPFEDQPELLKRPPIQYTFIEDEDWTIFVKDRLSDNFKEYREIQKERRKRNIYNHHLSRKGYAGLEEEMMVASGSTETIDRSILWKKARKKKDDTFDEVARPVIEKIDKLLKESQENGRSVSGSNDIFVEALGTPEYSGRVRAKGKHYTPRQYFNSVADRAVRDFIAASKEEQRIFQAEVLAKLSQVGTVTSQSDVSSSNMKQKQLLLPKAMDKSIRKVEDVTPPEAIEPQKKVRKCELAIGTKENIVAGGTIILECGPNYLVVVDAPYDSSAPLPIPIPGQTTTVGAAIGYQVLWPTDLVIIRTPILASKKAKKQKVNEVEVKSKGEKPQDMKNFETLVGLMLSTSRTHPINFPDDVFGESFKTFMMKEDMEMIISSKEVSSNCILYYISHLHRKLIDAKQAERYVFVNLALVSKAGMGEGSKENMSRVIADRLKNTKHAEYMLIPYNPDFHWVLVALEMKKMIAYYLDPMACQPCDDLKDIVNMTIRINPPEKQKTSKREPTWVKVVCPRQTGSVECGYYVMRYMKEIIANPNQLTSKLAVFSIWIILGVALL